MRALLLYNPNATTTRPAVRDAIARRLADELKLDVAPTKRRDHASYLAAGAAHEGYEVVLTLGGDGTANEALQGLVGTAARFAMLPGGSTNVWARSLGLPNDPLAATEMVLQRLRDRQERMLGLGSANGRCFGVNAGFGFDAEVVRYVEQRYRLKRTVRQASFVYCAVLAQASGFTRRGGTITVRPETGEQTGGLRTVVCCNTNPYTFLGRWPAQVCPEADFQSGLDLTGARRVGPVALVRIADAALRSARIVDLPITRLWHDQGRYELTSDRPLPLQVDGDYVGETTHVTLRSLPSAVTVVA